MGVLLSDVILPICNQNSVVQCLTLSANKHPPPQKRGWGEHTGSRWVPKHSTIPTDSIMLISKLVTAKFHKLPHFPDHHKHFFSWKIPPTILLHLMVLIWVKCFIPLNLPFTILVYVTLFHKNHPNIILPPASRWQRPNHATCFATGNNRWAIQITQFQSWPRHYLICWRFSSSRSRSSLSRSSLWCSLSMRISSLRSRSIRSRSMRSFSFSLKCM